MLKLVISTAETDLGALKVSAGPCLSRESCHSYQFQGLLSSLQSIAFPFLESDVIGNPALDAESYFPLASVAIEFCEHHSVRKR